MSSRVPSAVSSISYSTMTCCSTQMEIKGSGEAPPKFPSFVHCRIDSIAKPRQQRRWWMWWQRAGQWRECLECRIQCRLWRRKDNHRCNHKCWSRRGSINHTPHIAGSLLGRSKYHTLPQRKSLCPHKHFHCIAHSWSCKNKCDSKGPPLRHWIRLYNKLSNQRKPSSPMPKIH